MKAVKGKPGYIKSYKKSKLITTIILLLMITFIVVTVKLMFGDTSRVAIIFAILLSLPFAKYLIAFLMVKSYKSLSADNYQAIDDALQNEIILYDIVLSKYEGMKYYNAICVKNGWIYALVCEKDFKDNKKDYERWITDTVNDGKYEYKAACFDSIKAFTKKVKASGSPNENNALIDKYISERIMEMGV